jgi:hypothetical protein
VAGPIENTHYELIVPFPPDVVVGALLDFSDRRRRVWPETSHPAVYAIHSLDATHADVTEGVPFAWSRERYDWSDPGVVRLTQVDSNVARNGSIRYRIESTGAGTRIACDRTRTFFGWRGRLAWTLMTLAGGPILRRQLRQGIERHAGLASR